MGGCVQGRRVVLELQVQIVCGYRCVGAFVYMCVFVGCVPVSDPITFLAVVFEKLQSQLTASLC